MRTIARYPFVVLENYLLQLRPELGGGALGRAVGKVKDCSSFISAFRPARQNGRSPSREDRGGGKSQLTLLNTVLLGTTLILLLAGDTLNALVVVVLGGVALLGLLALCCSQTLVSHCLCCRTTATVP